MSSVPLRMCIVCRTMKPKNELFKIVKTPDNTIVPDKTGKLPGRGAYVCTDGSCISRLQKTKALERAFHCPVHTDVFQTIMKELI